MVYIDLELQYVGFKILFHLQGNYADFSGSGFNARLVFDTSGFIKLLEEAQNAVRDAARTVQNSIENANRKLTEAQQQILQQLFHYLLHQNSGYGMPRPYENTATAPVQGHGSSIFKRSYYHLKGHSRTANLYRSIWHVCEPVES